MTMIDEKADKQLQKLFPSIVGQRAVLKKLKFLVDIQHKTGILNPILITGPRGTGKNSIGTALAKILYSQDNKSEHKTIVEVNCSSIDSETQFFDEIVNQYIVNKNVTIILDEFHCFNKTKLIDMFLSIWNTNETYINRYIHGGNTYDFDLRKVSWIVLTSEPQLIPETLITRLEVVQLQDLTVKELSQIVGRRLANITVEDGLLEEIANFGRFNGRECDKLGEKLSQYVLSQNKSKLQKSDWNYIKNELGLRYLGINNIEYNIMKFLKNSGPSSLTKLSSALQLTTEATRASFERYLLANNLIEVVTAKGRLITNSGRKYLEENPE